jgi:hypothetical protein
MKNLFLLIPILFLGFASYAQEATPNIDSRYREQRARIREGRANGNLTHKEAARLNAQQRHIRRTEYRAKSDGRVTRGERKRPHHEQNRASRNIRRQKHDAQTRNFQ